MKLKRILSLLTVMAMLFSCVGITAMAEETVAVTVVTAEADLSANLEAGGSIKLGGNIEVFTEIKVPAGVTATLDLAGYSITSGYQADSTTKHIYPINNYGTLTIEDSSSGKTGSISGRGIYVQDGSKLTVVSGAIYGIDSNGGSALYQYGGDIVINGGRVEQKAEGTSNFAINAGGGTVTVNGGWIGGNHGAIAAVGATVVINDGELVCTGSADMTDNVLYTSGTGTITINGGTFVGDNESGAGGCCVYDVNGGATINGGNFSNSSGGDVWGTTGTVINGGTFEELTETSHVAVGATITNGGVTYVKTESGLEVAPDPATISSAQINMDDTDEVFISAEISGLDKAPATESVVIKTYSGETLVATTTLANTGYFSLATLGVKICLTGDSSSWDTAWEEGMPRADVVPDKNVLYVDGVAVSEAAVPMIRTGGEAAVNWADLPGVYPAPATPAGALNKAYISASYVGGVPAVFGEATGVVATDSFVVKLYSGETLVGTATLVDNDKVLLDGTSRPITWHAALADDGDSWWSTKWEGGALNVNALPDTAVLWVDSVQVDTCNVELNIQDLEKPVFAAVTDEDGNVQSFVAGTGYLNGTGDNAAVYDEALQTAISAANAGKTIALLRDITISETVKVDFKGEITIDGNGHKITNNGATNAAVMLGNSLYNDDTYKATRKVTLKNVVFDGWTTDHVVRAQGVTATIEGCTFINCNQTKGLGLLTLTFADATVSNCVFKNNNCVEVIDVNSWGDKSKADVTIKECTFENNTASGLYGLTGIIAAFYGDVSIENNDFVGNTAEINIIYTETNADVNDNYFYGNTLANDEEKNAVVMAGPWHDGDYTVNIKRNAFTDAYKGAYVEQFEKYPDAVTAYNLSSNYWNGGKPNYGTTGEPNVELNDYYTAYTDGTLSGLVSTATHVAQIGDVKYETLQEALDAAAAGTGNVTVEILEDIDLTNVDWNPVTVSAPGYPVVTVNGNNKTIKGLNDMLFAGTWAGNSGLIINDLTIADSNIVNDKDDTEGTVGVGAFIGYPQASETITLNNCHLVNSTVEGGHWTGGLIGMAGGYNGNDGPVFMNLTITGCSVTGSTITGKGSAGGVIGHGSCAAWTNVVIENTIVSGNTITSTGSSTNKAGAVMGTIGAAGQSTTAAGETKTGGASVSATVSNNTVTSNGTTITTIYGRQGTETGMLYVAGGTYDNNPIEENVTYAQPAEGYEIVQNEDGTYGVQEKVPVLPEAEVTNLGAITVGNNEGEYQFDGSYHIYDLIGGTGLSSSTEPFDMNIAMQFVAKDSEEEAKANAYAEYTTDFFIKIDGIENGSFVGNGCYLAGYYPSFGAWVKIPLDGFTVENGRVYPVITSAGLDFSYVDICTSVEDFICGIYLTPEILEANPGINVNLALGLAENLEAAQRAEFVKVDDYTYTAEDFKEVELFDFYGSNAVLGSSLSMEFYVADANLEGTDYYAEIKHYTAGEVITTKIPYSEWEVASVGYHKFTYSNLAARQIADKLEVAIFTKDGEQVSVTREDGLRAYAFRAFDAYANKGNITESNQKLLTAVTDMLNYGAAAQKEFGYNTENLANFETEEYQKYATADVPVLEDIREKDEKVYGTNLTLKNRIILSGYFAGVTSDMYAKITFTDHYDNEYVITVPYNEFIINGSYHQIDVDELAIADAAVPVTITVYNADGTEHSKVVESINSYLCRAMEAYPDKEIFPAIAKFAASALDTLHNQ